MSRVPGALGLPMALKASPPWLTIQATLDRVSTLLMTVGRWYRPLTVRRGGRLRG